MRRAMPFASAATRASFAARGRGRVDHLLVQNAPGARSHEHDAVGEPNGLANVVRHEDDRLAGRAPDPLDLALEDLARLRVERGERLVHQEDRGVGRERARDRAALAHAAGQLVRVAIAEAPEVHQAEQLLAPRGPRRLASRPWIFSGNSTLSRRVSHGKERRVLEDDRAVRARAPRRPRRRDAPAPTSAWRARRPGSGWWTCRSRRARGGRRTPRRRPAARRSRKISTTPPCGRHARATRPRARCSPQRAPGEPSTGAADARHGRSRPTLRKREHAARYNGRSRRASKGEAGLPRHTATAVPLTARRR